MVLSSHLAQRCCLLACLLLPLPALAQEELNDNRQILEHKAPGQAMTEVVYKRLGAVHEMIGDGDMQRALTDLERLANMRLNNHESALVQQTFGFVYVQMDRNQEALQSFEASLAMEALPHAVTQGLMYSLAGLYAAEGQYMKSIETMREWFRYEAEPRPEAYMMIASAFAELEEYDSALPYVQKAIARSPEPKENWYMLEVAIHLEGERYREAIAVLRTMLKFWPGVARYWDMLAGMHLELGEDRPALDAMMIAYAKGFLDTEAKLIAAAQLNLLLEIPFTAGELLEKGINDGVIERNVDNLEMLLLAWTNAREYDKAIATIDELAPLGEDGKYYMQKAGIANERGDWELAIVAAGEALEAGLEEPVEAHMIAGMANAELGRFDDAIAAFELARSNGDTEERANAASWIAFVEEKVQLQAARIN